MDHDLIRSRITTPKKGRRKVFVSPEPEDFKHGKVLCFDQTLSKTGWSLLHRDETGLSIPFTGLLLAPEPDHRGFEQTLRKSISMKHQMEEVVGTMGLDVDAIVHEMPAVVGYRTESSLCAAQALWSVCDDFNRNGSFVKAGPLVMISKQRAYRLLVGSKDTSSKTKVTETVNRLIDPERRKNVRRWNQDVHDATLLGLTHLYDPQEPS